MPSLPPFSVSLSLSNFLHFMLGLYCLKTLHKAKLQKKKKKKKKARDGALGERCLGVFLDLVANYADTICTIVTSF